MGGQDEEIFEEDSRLGAPGRVVVEIERHAGWETFRGEEEEAAGWAGRGCWVKGGRGRGGGEGEGVLDGFHGGFYCVGFVFVVSQGLN